jgi:hypothetical protein
LRSSACFSEVFNLAVQPVSLVCLLATSFALSGELLAYHFVQLDAVQPL